jgi:hypothetical protein
MKFLIRLLIINLILISSTGNLFNQQKANVLLQGKVIDGTSGKSVGTSLYFINSKGKPAHCLANSLDGSYQQALPSGDVYYLVVKGYLPETNASKFDLPTDTKYQEITTDIYLKPFQPKTELFKFKLFEPNDSVLINKEFIQYIKTFNTFNSEVKLNFILSSYDSWLDNSKRRVEKIDKKGKVTYKTENYTTKDRLSDLLSSRITALRNELKDNNIFIKLTSFIKDLQVVPQSKKQMKRTNTDKSKKNTIFIPDFDNVKVVIAK